MLKSTYLLKLAESSQEELLIYKRFRSRTAKWQPIAVEKLNLSPKLRLRIAKYDLLRQTKNIESKKIFDTFVDEYFHILNNLSIELTEKCIITNPFRFMTKSSSQNYYTYLYVIENQRRKAVINHREEILGLLSHKSLKAISKKIYKSSTNKYLVTFVLKGPKNDDRNAQIDFINMMREIIHQHSLISPIKVSYS